MSVLFSTKLIVVSPELLTKKMKITSILASLPFVGFGQNLQFDTTTALEFDVMPVEATYVGLTKVCMKPFSGNDFTYKSTAENFINRRVYTIVEDPAQSDFYFTFHVTMTTTNPQRTTSQSQTKTRKDGSTYTETTYTTEFNEKITTDVNMYTKEGVQVRTSRKMSDYAYSGTGNTREASVNDMINKKSKAQMGSVNGLLESSFNVLESQYMIEDKTLMPMSISVKSRKMDYSDINRVAELVKTWMQAKTYDPNDSGIVEALKLIELAINEHEPENKKARIDNEVAAVCFYYKAYIFFAMKRFTEANEMILKSESLDKRIHFSQEELKKTLATMKERNMYN